MTTIQVKPQVIAAIDETYEKTRAMWFQWKSDPRGQDQYLDVDIEDYLKQMIRYISKFYKKVGQGSSRTVFKMDDSHVLKVGIGFRDIAEISIDKGAVPPFQKGGAQNGVERRARDAMDNKYIAGVIAHDSKMKWVVSEYARSIKNEDEFEKLTGIPFGYGDDNSLDPESAKPGLTTILQDLERATDADVKRLMIKYKEQFTNPWLAGLIKSLPKLGPGAKDDMEELYQWGYVKGKGVVLSDYGFNKKIAKKYYEEEE